MQRLNLRMREDIQWKCRCALNPLLQSVLLVMFLEKNKSMQRTAPDLMERHLLGIASAKEIASFTFIRRMHKR